MKQINIRESLLDIDRKTCCQYDLTTLYECANLEDEDKIKLVQYIDSCEDPCLINEFLEDRCRDIFDETCDDCCEIEKFEDDLDNPETSYQLDCKTEGYAEEIAQVFDDVQCKGKLILARKGNSLEEGFKDDLKAVAKTAGKVTKKVAKNAWDNSYTKAICKGLKKNFDKTELGKGVKEITDTIKETDTYKKAAQGVKDAKDFVKSNVGNKERNPQGLSIEVRGKKYRMSDLKFKVGSKEISPEEYAKMSMFQRKNVRAIVPKGTKALKEDLNDPFYEFAFAVSVDCQAESDDTDLTSIKELGDELDDATTEAIQDFCAGVQDYIANKMSEIDTEITVDDFDIDYTHDDRLYITVQVSKKISLEEAYNLAQEALLKASGKGSQEYTAVDYENSSKVYGLNIPDCYAGWEEYGEKDAVVGVTIYPNTCKGTVVEE